MPAPINSQPEPSPKLGKRVCLFLQGPASPLFAKIADHLSNGGWTCLRINLNVGDQIFWRRKGAVNYRGSLKDWPNFVLRFMEEHQVSDLIMIGEERDYHRAAVEAAKALGIRRFAVDMGYLRPDWVTIEREGLSSNSLFPSSPEVITELAKHLDEPDLTPIYRQTFLAEAIYDLLYNLPNVFLWFLFPRYQRHALFHPLAEYAGWLRRLKRKKAELRAADACINRLEANDVRYFTYPMQLETDFQLRAHSPYHRQQDAIFEVLRSFAAHAHERDVLVFKTHPLDNDLISWKSIIRTACQRLEIEKRVHLIDGGDLNRMIATSQGMITVNSSAALNSLRVGKAVKVLGSAIFDIDGLSDQRPLGSFWRGPKAPDQTIVKAFFRLLAASLQVRGNLSSQEGSSAAASAIAARLLHGTVNQPADGVLSAQRQKPKKRKVLEIS